MDRVKVLLFPPFSFSPPTERIGPWLAMVLLIVCRTAPTSGAFLGLFRKTCKVFFRVASTLPFVVRKVTTVFSAVAGKHVLGLLRARSVVR